MKDEVFDNLVLDKEEQWIEDHLEEFKTAPKWVGESLREAAKNTMKEIKEKENKKMITMRLEGNDIARLKEESKNQGLPYQSLISSVLHKYLNGTLVDIGEIKKVLSFQVK